MLHMNNIKCDVNNLICEISIKIDDDALNASQFNCDLWINENYLLFNWNNINKRITSNNEFDIKDLKKIEINYSKSSSTFSFQVPCLPGEKIENKNIKDDKYSPKTKDNSFDILKLKKITDTCILKVDGIEIPIEQTYGYGFNSMYNEDTSLVKADLKSICRIKNPSHKSPIDRCYRREVDESRDFCQEQYKLNFIELQVPEGLENPMNYTFNFQDQNLNEKEENTLKTICSKTDLPSLSEKERQRVNNDLVGLLFAICYDIRINAGDQNCVSGWTRSILSAALNYFEPTLNLESAIEVFLRRSLTYPLYRNYDLSRLCVDDTIQALQKGYNWILKHLISTYYMFLESEDSRQLLNKYFIEDFIRYVKQVATVDDFKFLAKNLKNSSLRIIKKNLRLQLPEIETELLKELISDIHLADSDDSDDDNLWTDEDDDDDDSSTSDEGDENPYISNLLR